MKLLLADDHELFNESFSLLLKKIFPDSLVTKAENWAAVKLLAQTSSFDLAILDLFMPTTEPWYQELEELVSLDSIGSVCILSSSLSQDNVKKAFEAGAKGYIHKSSSLAEIKKAFSLMLDGKAYLPYQLQQEQVPQGNLGGLIKLTVRQHKILSMLAEGKDNRSIADSLNIKESTVKRHVYNIFKQLGVANRTEAVHVARQHGLLQND